MERIPGSAIQWGLAGFAIGAFLVLILAGFSLSARVGELAAVRQAVEEQPTPVPSPPPSSSPPSPTPIAQLERTPAQSSTEGELTAAEAMLEQGDGEAALERLLPLLNQVTQAEELARLNSDLARAEFLLGHFQRAAGYFEAAFAYGPTPELLLELASCYDLGGDLHMALARYLRLADWADAPADLRQIARERARDIVGVLGTPTPGP